MSVEPRYQRMDSNAEARVAIADVIASAQRELCVFDVKPATLRERETFAAPQLEHIRTLLLANRNHRLRIVLHNTDSIESELPRLLLLLRQLSSQIAIHRTTGVASDAQDVMLIADDHSIWRKPVAAHPRSILECGDPSAVRPHAERFEEIWASTEIATSGTNTGL